MTDQPNLWRLRVPPSKDEIIKDLDPDADKKVDDLPAHDFLLRLQDSLKLDMSLVTPQIAVLPQQITASDAVVGGNPLPQQEGELDAALSSDGGLSLAAGQAAQPLSSDGGLSLAAGQAAQPLSSDGGLSLAAGQAAQPVAGKVAADPSSQQASRVVTPGKLGMHSFELPSTGEIGEASDVMTPAERSAQKQEDATARGDNLPRKGDAHSAVTSGKGERELSGAERMAQLARVLPVDESAHSVKPGEPLIPQEGGDSRSDSSANSTMTGKGQTAQVATQAATHGAALKAFSDGLRQPDTGTATAPVSAESAANATTNTPHSAGQGVELNEFNWGRQGASVASANQGGAQSATAPGSVAQSSMTSHTATQSDGSTAPVMVAPQQVLAQAESQGAQASLSSISAGIKQMEVTGADEVRKAFKLEVKPKVGEPDKSLLATTSSGESSQSQSVQHGQNSQPQPQVTDSRSPAAEGMLRREPQNLPHLKLASQEAPAELQQKVNVMLAEKLQQAEIQLDPLGLGKMKIQIQIGADSQANVHFVVQHGQTREMLEQTMPRLREMLAGQGIQLGQTQVSAAVTTAATATTGPASL